MYVHAKRTPNYFFPYYAQCKKLLLFLLDFFFSWDKNFFKKNLKPSRKSNGWSLWRFYSNKTNNWKGMKKWGFSKIGNLSNLPTLTPILASVQHVQINYRKWSIEIGVIQQFPYTGLKVALWMDQVPTEFT